VSADALEPPDSSKTSSHLSRAAGKKVGGQQELAKPVKHQEKLRL